MFLTKLLLVLYIPLIYCKVDYYELLGITKTATNQEIRRAFKKLAVTLHPDKNQDDPEAHDKFIKITRAYEVLKDADKRKHYDIHGEDDSQAHSKPQYHSYTYYRDHFGIYDDDPHIVTFSQVDFETTIEDSDSQWFVNFYSPMCHTCHHLAPVWRSLAEELNGAVYFGAVNCEEDWSLCRQQGINSYPTLVFYPTNEVLIGVKTRDELDKFIMSRLKSDIVFVNSKQTWDAQKETQSNWLLFLSSSSNVPKSYKITAAMLKGLLGVAVINCQKMPCDDWDRNNGDLVYMTKRNMDLWASTHVKATSSRDVFNEVLSLLPGLLKIDDNKFQEIMEGLQEGSQTPWLIYFYMGAETKLDAEVKKLPALLNGFKIGRINCGRHSELCHSLSISRYPLFGVFKPGGGWEFYHGSETAQGVAGFAREAAAATNLRTIGEEEFSSEIRRGGPLFVDFYAPWCPPCLRLLPQLRKASLSFSPGEVSFATVDCTVHRSLCAGQGVQAYPTTLLFNATRKQTFRGHSAASIIEFVQDILHPHVIELNYDTFYETVAKKKEGTIWMVGYFMPWCGPCQQLAPHYRKLAKMVSDMPYVKIAEVNCEVEGLLCQERGVRSYPHIEIHPYESRGLSSKSVFSGYQRDAHTLKRWLFKFIPSPVVDLTPYSFSQITSEASYWLIDFYAPWCGHCISFEPEFIAVAKKLEDRVKSGKMNCENYPQVCQRAGVSGYPTVKFYSPQHLSGVEIHSQNPKMIIESVESLIKRNSRFSDEL